MRRLLNLGRPPHIGRGWKLPAAIVVAVALSAGLAVTLSNNGGGKNTAPRTQVLARRPVHRAAASARSTHRASRARHSHPTHAAGHTRASHHRAQLASSTLIGVGNVRGCLEGSTSGLPILHAYHASVLRIVVQAPYGQDGQALPCVRAARAAGLKVNIAIGYNNLWSTRRIVAYFRHVLGSYARYAWAISIGNEQEVSAGKGAPATPAGYAAVWRAVEPVVASLAPGAVRVAGEISPWGFSFLRGAYASGLPGAQAIAVHPYAASFAFKLSRVVSWAQATRLPLWATEGLAGPSAWSKPTQHAVPLSRLAGVTLASAWVAQ
jgi:hypothetical protein